MSSQDDRPSPRAGAGAEDRGVNRLSQIVSKLGENLKVRTAKYERLSEEKNKN
jgi:hypothetical protein